jgi:hypothetical protein
MDNPFTLGVMQTEKGDGTETVMAEFVAFLLAQGKNVGGLIQVNTHHPDGLSQVELVDVRTQDRYLISQPLGKASTGCRLDPAGLCDASAVLRREIDAKPDLIVINKFGIAEAEGKGILQELFTALELGIPVLTSVSGRYRDDWNKIMDDSGQFLAPTVSALKNWWDDISSTGHAHRS